MRSPATIAAIFVPWLGSSLFLRRHLKTWGRERRYLDYWSIPHFLTGSLLQSLGVGLAWVAPVAIAWEGYEIATGIGEYRTNRVIDVLLALAGWLVADAAPST